MAESTPEILNIVYQVLLKMVDIFEYAFNIFSGVKNVTVNNGSKETEDFFLNFLFTNSGISKVFWGLTGIAFLVAAIMVITAFIRANMDTENKKTVGRVIGLVGKTGVTFLIIPFATLLILSITDIVINKVDSVFLNNAESLSSTVNSLAIELSENINSSADVLSITGIVVTTFLIVFMAMSSFVVLVRIFEMLLLYLMSPFFVVSMPIDDGKRFNEWVKMFALRLCSCLGIIVAMKLYLFIIPVVIRDTLHFSNIIYVDVALKLVFICGGMFAVYKSNKLITQIFEEDKKEEVEEKDIEKINPEVKLLGDGKKKETSSNLWNGFNSNLYKR